MHSPLRPWSAWIVLALLAASGCPTKPLEPGTRDTPARLDIGLRLRPSCGFDTSEYDTQCLKALLLIVHRADDDDRTICQPLDPVPENIQRLIFASEPQIRFAGLSSEGVVSFELVGLHDKNPDMADAGTSALCDDADNFNNWLFFGQSAEVDLGSLADPDAGDLSVDIPIDCRDCDMGCTGLGLATCPTNPISFCVPGTASLTCEKPCQDDGDCFNGALTCDEDRCDQDGAPPTRFCDACTSDDDCDPSLGIFCVGLPGETTGLCAYRCPQNSCPTGARCNRLGNRLHRVGAQAASP